MLNRKMRDMLAMMMVGDGVVALTRPQAHVSAWRVGLPGWDDMIGFFEREPGLTRMIGAAELLTGLMIVYKGLDR